MGEMAILCKKGDLKVIWDPGREAEVKAAEKQFEDLKKEGYKAFKVKDDGSQGKQITKFDKKAGKIIMVPALVGG